MITETTAISCAAFGALSTGLLISAGIGWIRCARMLASEIDRAEAFRRCLDKEEARSDRLLIALNDKVIAWAAATADRDKCKLRAEQYASAWGRVMRLLRLAEAANHELRTNQLQREVASSTQKLRRVA